MADLDEWLADKLKPTNYNLLEITWERLSLGRRWWCASVNAHEKEAYECRKAILIRNRLGSGDAGGIPLWAELKTKLVFVAHKDEPREVLKFVAAHTRGNTAFNNELILSAVGLDSDAFFILDDQQAADLFGYAPRNILGLVNPMNIDAILSEIVGGNIQLEEVFQLFDKSVLLHGGLPNTLMTNLGDRKFAFEMHGISIVESTQEFFPSTSIENISEECNYWKTPYKIKKKWLAFPPPYGPKIGILTGNSPESGKTLWEDILIAYRRMFKNKTDVSMPEIILHSYPLMGLSMELRKREEYVWNGMREALLDLLNAGCKIITLACNTTIYYEPRIIELCIQYNAKFISIAEACMPAVRQALEATEGDKQVGMIGIGAVVNMDEGYSGYQKHLEREGIAIVPCPSEDLAFKVKCGNEIDDGHRDDFIGKLGEKLPDVKVVILALTEMSMTYRYQKNKSTWAEKRTYIDPLSELAKYIVYEYLCEGYKSPVCKIPRIEAAMHEINRRLSIVNYGQAS